MPFYLDIFVLHEAIFFSFATCPNVTNSLIIKDTVIGIAGPDVGALLLCLVGEKWEAVFIHTDYQLV